MTYNYDDVEWILGKNRGLDVGFKDFELVEISLVPLDKYCTGFVYDDDGVNQALFEKTHGLAPGSMNVVKETA